MHKVPLLMLITITTLSVTQDCVVNGIRSHEENNNTVFPQAVGLDTKGLTKESFPKGFTFGTATSAFQVEGMASKQGRGPSILDTFYKIPGRVANNGSAEVADDQYHRYKEDIDIMKNLNFEAYKFSISWSRIFPNGTGEINWKGVGYYNRLINYLLKKGITPYANLNHYDLPQALEDRYNGWLNKQVVKDFADYAEFCFETFGDRVKNWYTLNEPRCMAEFGYDNGGAAPGRCSKAVGNCTEGNSATEPYIVAHNLILCHGAAVQRYRKYQAKKEGRIGILLDFSWYEPLTRSKADQDAAQRARDFQLGWFLHPIVYGEYPKTIQNIAGNRLPKFSQEETMMVKGSIDYVGLNHYSTSYAYDKKPEEPETLRYHTDCHCEVAYERHGVPIGQRANANWLYIVPWGLYKAVTYVKEHYGNPAIIISESGMDDPGNVTLPDGIFDNTRMEYYRSYLSELKRAVDDGVNVIGYFAWSLLDNFEWASGYTSRFGIVYVDFKTLKRYPKTSAYWFQRLLKDKKH